MRNICFSSVLLHLRLIFCFDYLRVLPDYASQGDVFEAAVKPLIRNFVSGYAPIYDIMMTIFLSFILRLCGKIN